MDNPTNFNLAQQKIFKTIKSFKVGEIFIGDRFTAPGLSDKEIKTVILYALQKQLVVPVYRLATKEKIVNQANTWTPDLPNFAQVFTLANGTTINGCDPKNIEVGFKRVTHSCPQCEDLKAKLTRTQTNLQEARRQDNQENDLVLDEVIADKERYRAALQKCLNISHCAAKVGNFDSLESDIFKTINQALNPVQDPKQQDPK